LARFKLFGLHSSLVINITTLFNNNTQGRNVNPSEWETNYSLVE